MTLSELYEFKIKGLRYLVAALSAFCILEAFIVWIQAENNKQLIYDLNVSQTQLMIQKAEYKKLESQIAEGLCLPRLEMK